MLGIKVSCTVRMVQEKAGQSGSCPLEGVLRLSGLTAKGRGEQAWGLGLALGGAARAMLSYMG